MQFHALLSFSRSLYLDRLHASKYEARQPEQDGPDRTSHSCEDNGIGERPFTVADNPAANGRSTERSKRGYGES